MNSAAKWAIGAGVLLVIVALVGIGLSGDGFVPQPELPVGGLPLYQVIPWRPVREVGITELIGVDEEVNTDDFGASVQVDLAETATSGEILSVCLYSDGGGIQTSAGVLYVYDVDPQILSGITTTSNVTNTMVVGQKTFYASDWSADASSARACMAIALPFHDVRYLYFAWLHTDATDLNDAGGDNERLQMNVWIRSDS